MIGTGSRQSRPFAVTGIGGKNGFFCALVGTGVATAAETSKSVEKRDAKETMTKRLGEYTVKAYGVWRECLVWSSHETAACGSQDARSADP